MNKDQLLQLRSSIEAQLSWALQHNGDEELVDILRSESARLSEIIDAQRSHCPSPTAAGFAPGGSPISRSVLTLPR
jgi:hypothetical protein